jgi:hypothetical protein
VHIQRLVSVAKIATMLEVCTTEEKCSVVLFLLAEGLNTKDIHKKKVSHLWLEVFVT